MKSYKVEVVCDDVPSHTTEFTFYHDYEHMQKIREWIALALRECLDFSEDESITVIRVTRITK